MMKDTIPAEKNLMLNALKADTLLDKTFKRMVGVKHIDTKGREPNQMGNFIFTALLVLFILKRIFKMTDNQVKKVKIKV